MIPIMYQVDVSTTGTAGVSFTESFGPFRGEFIGVAYTSGGGTSYFISTTALLKVSGAVTGLTYLTSATPVGGGGAWFPRCDLHTSTGGVRIAGSTETSVCGFYPVCNEKITLSIFNSCTTAGLGTMYVVVAGQGTTG